MSFPSTPLPITTELFIDGAWVDISTYVRNEGNVNIERGYRSEQGDDLTVDQLTLTLNNRDGRFSNRNPSSPYYKKLGRNTRIRVTKEDEVNGTAAYFPGRYHGGSWARTAASAALNITGDIDIRGDILPHSWRPKTSQILAAKWDEVNGDFRAWVVLLTTTGHLQLIWSAFGSSNTLIATSTVPVASSGRQAWRITLDVNNGAAGNTTTFYTSTSVTGTHTQLGATVVKGGTTAIVSDAATQVTVGNSEEARVLTDGDGVPASNYAGYYYEFQVYNGIAGTLRADADFATQTLDDNSWTGGAGESWTMDADDTATRPVITSGSRRFYGEVSEFPQKWDTSGTDIYTPIVASSVVRRLSQGAQLVDSAMKNYLDGPLTSVYGYFPLVSGTTTRTPSGFANLGGYPDARLTAGVTFGAESDLYSTEGAATIADNARIEGSFPTFGGGGGSIASGFFIFKFGTPPPFPEDAEVLRFVGNGTVSNWTIVIDSAAFYVAGFDSNMVVLGGVVTDTWASGVSPGDWIALRLQVSTTGGNIAVRVDYHKIGEDTIYSEINTSYVAGTSVGQFTYFYVNPDGDTDNNTLKIAYVSALETDMVTDSDNFVAAANSFLGEAAGDRFIRVGELADINVETIGDPADTMPMGPQRVAPPLVILQECSDTDGGFIFAARDYLGLVMRTQRSMVVQTPLELDYTANHFDGDLLRPVDDDKTLRNDVTVTTALGDSARSTVDTGPNNTQSPEDDPEGVGRYDTSYQRNPETGTGLRNLAHYGTYLGTWDELRYPQVQVSLERQPFVTSTVLSYAIQEMEIGDCFRITNLPDWLPPGDVDLLIRGTSETMMNRGWRHVWNNQNYGPFREVNDLATDSVYTRAAATDSTLVSDVTTSATSLVVKTPQGAMWRRSSGAPTDTFPMEIIVGAEEMECSALANVTWSFVAAGTVAHNLNASVSPGAVAGLATGDLMFMLAAIRGTAATINTPSGWTKLVDSENMALFGRVAEASGNTPTVSFSGGSASDDTSAQMCAFRPSSPTGLGLIPGTGAPADFLQRYFQITNASAQDITYPAMPTEENLSRDNGLVIYIGWKQDDWTSVASPGTEIGEPDTTTGNDQGIVWSYTIQTTFAPVASGVFTVTGGAGAVSKGAIAFFHTRTQLFTVSRSENGVVQTHTTGDDVQVLRPFHAGL